MNKPKQVRRVKARPQARKRRHLTPSQIAMVTARAESVYEEAARKRMKAGVSNLAANLQQGTALGLAARATGVSERSAAYAKKVIKQGTPELVKAVASLSDRQLMARLRKLRPDKYA